MADVFAILATLFNLELSNFDYLKIGLSDFWKLFSFAELLPLYSSIVVV